MEKGETVLIGFRIKDTHGDESKTGFYWACMKTFFGPEYTYKQFYEVFEPKNWEPVYAVVK